MLYKTFIKIYIFIQIDIFITYFKKISIFKFIFHIQLI